MDDFLQYDQERELLLMIPNLQMVYKPIELIARIYVSETLDYPEQSQYWVMYAHELAEHIYDDCQSQNEIDITKSETNLKRVQSLSCAYLIDNDEIDQASELLEDL